MLFGLLKHIPVAAAELHVISLCRNTFFIFPFPASVPASVFFSAFFFSCSPESACTFLSFKAAPVSLDTPCVTATPSGNFCSGGCCVLQKAISPTNKTTRTPSATLRLPGCIRKCGESLRSANPDNHFPAALSTSCPPHKNRCGNPWPQNHTVPAAQTPACLKSACPAPHPL